MNHNRMFSGRVLTSSELMSHVESEFGLSPEDVAKIEEEMYEWVGKESSRFGRDTISDEKRKKVAKMFLR